MVVASEIRPHKFEIPRSGNPLWPVFVINISGLFIALPKSYLRFSPNELADISNIDFCGTVLFDIEYLLGFVLILRSRGGDGGRSSAFDRWKRKIKLKLEKLPVLLVGGGGGGEWRAGGNSGRYPRDPSTTTRTHGPKGGFQFIMKQVSPANPSRIIGTDVGAAAGKGRPSTAKSAAGRHSISTADF